MQVLKKRAMDVFYVLYYLFFVALYAAAIILIAMLMGRGVTNILMGDGQCTEKCGAFHFTQAEQF